MEVTYGSCFWVSVSDVGLPGLLYIRFGDRGVEEMYLQSDGEPLTAAHLRGLPLSKITTVALARADLMMGMRNDPDTPDVRAMFRDVVPPRFVRPGRTDTSARLSPPSAGLTEAFLRDVARAYTAAVARGEHPNQALAEQTHTPQRTIERWVYLARKSGAISPARRKASGS